ncbi:hypothetical protein [Streptomyces vilmorinianum]|uniref:hypothetical protein n=1 Tax=Streptomyces vilmorinianum TaxID=3051092 RepID=UPI0010FAE552|nr:hypothetical protein [Streptomyces vilmorinianum]
MANQNVRVAAAARAASKRAAKARRPISSPTLTVPVESDGPEPKPESKPESKPNAQPNAQPQPKPKSGTPPHFRRPALLTAALATLVLAGLTATTALGLQYRDSTRTTEARTSAAAAARKAAPAILSYDYRHLDTDFATARTHLTPPFLDEYTKTTTTVVAPTARQYQGVVKATIAKPPGADASASVSVVSASPDKAVILLFMNQVTTSTRISGPRVDLNRVRMTLVRTPQGWKVSAVDAL